MIYMYRTQLRKIDMPMNDQRNYINKYKKKIVWKLLSDFKSTGIDLFASAYNYFIYCDIKFTSFMAVSPSCDHRVIDGNYS
jgi:hypothetical protein